MEVSGRLHIPDALPQGKEPPLPIAKEEVKRTYTSNFDMSRHKYLDRIGGKPEFPASTVDGGERSIRLIYSGGSSPLYRLDRKGVVMRKISTLVGDLTSIIRLALHCVIYFGPNDTMDFSALMLTAIIWLSVNCSTIAWPFQYNPIFDLNSDYVFVSQT
jgi:hypothetical protein